MRENLFQRWEELEREVRQARAIVSKPMEYVDLKNISLWLTNIAFTQKRFNTLVYNTERFLKEEKIERFLKEEGTK
jgi:hypothetical protein